MRTFPRFSALAMLSAAAILAGCTASPVPLQETEIADRATDYLQRVTADQEPITGAVDLYEAMARALKYNLDHRVEAMDAALRIRELDLSHFNLLPNVVAKSGYAARDRFSASSSFNILTQTSNFGASTSQEKKIKTADIEFSWNILDFGLSYVRARQAGDKVLLAQEMRRKVMHRIVEDVRTAYWRAVSGERLLKKLHALERRVRRAQRSSRSIAAERSSSPIIAVTYERELVGVKRAILELERDLVIAKTQLAALINVDPGTPFRLAIPKRRTAQLAVNMNVQHMVWTAMNNRAELRDVWYKERINQHEADAAFLELLPGIQAYAGTNYDSNEFLYNHNWLTWGAKASWNLLRIVQYPAKRRVIEAQGDLLDQRALAVTMAIMTQVHISRVRFHHFRKELQTAKEYLNVQRRLLRLMRIESSAGRISDQNIIREEMNTLVAEAKRDIAHASLQNAFANIFASMGLDTVDPSFSPDQSVASLAASLREIWFERGDYAAVRRYRQAKFQKN